MYLYWSSVILLFGVEINRVIKEAEEGVASTSDGAASTSARTRGA
jgi:uncharacterized BrkB/YihY/UPF0761 family membrane protein